MWQLIVASFAHRAPSNRGWMERGSTIRKLIHQLCNLPFAEPTTRSAVTTRARSAFLLKDTEGIILSTRKRRQKPWAKFTAESSPFQFKIFCLWRRDIPDPGIKVHEPMLVASKTATHAEPFWKPDQATQEIDLPLTYTK